MSEAEVVPQRTVPATGHTKLGRTWTFLAAAAVGLLLLLVFIIQNNKPVPIHFLGLHGSLSLGVSILLAAVIGALITVVVGSARMIQLKRRKS